MKGGPFVLSGGKVWNGRKFEIRPLYVNDGWFVSPWYSKANWPVVDVTGLFVFPGFVDSHAHVIGTGLKELTFDLTKVKLEDVLKQSSGPGVDFVIARGWSELPPNEELALANSLDKPVFLVRRCGHVAWVNDHLKRKLGFGDNLIVEDQLRKVWESFGDELYEEAFEKGVQTFLSYGVTQVHSDDFHGISFQKLLELLGRSKLRIFEKLCTNEPWRYEFGTFGICELRGIKVFADGSLGGRTAYMLEPYRDTGTYGIDTLPENFTEIVRFAEENELQVCVHTIGDRALRKVLDAFDSVGTKLKHRLIHLQFVSFDDFKRLRRYYLSVQPHFFFEDEHMLSNVKSDLAYPYYAMFTSNYQVAFSTDSPVSSADPRYVIECALKRWFKLEEAIWLFTEAGARMLAHYGVRAGRLEPGYLADFALYDGNPLETKPLAVFVNGIEVYRRAGA